MRRCVRAATTPPAAPWRAGSSFIPIWRFSAFYSSSKFIGRRSSGSKKLGAFPRMPHAVKKSSTDVPRAAESPVDTTAVQTSVIEEDKEEEQPHMCNNKRTKSKRSSQPCTEAKQCSNSREGKQALAVTGTKSCNSSEGSTAQCLPCVTDDKNTQKEREGENVCLVDRAVVLKLFVVSDALAFMFATSPKDQRCVNWHLKKVDQSVIMQPPTQAPRSQHKGQEGITDNDSNSKDKKDARRESRSRRREQRNAVTREYNIALRVLSEESADNVHYIHVREMERLVPPADVLPRNAMSTVLASKKGNENSKRRQSSEKRNSKVQKGRGTSPAEPSAAALEALGRVMALRQWQTAALRKAQESQRLHALPPACHAITHVYMNDPSLPDTTVVQGCNIKKSVTDILDLMKQSTVSGNLLGFVNLHKGRKSSSSGNKGTTPSATLSMPFELKPLLSVVASCIPRSDAALGVRFDEDGFLRSVLQRHSRKSGSNEPTTAVAQVVSEEERQTATDRELSARRVPPVPRYTTRVVLLIDYDSSESWDLHSDGVSSEKKAKSAEGDSGEEVVNRRRRRKEPHIYCLIADGGEV
ncbi:hypothetical protein DPX39_040032000 [Trypanosoma brucei equiperdum]|uniref:Uncharacterized protein n=1 Tax=Trypanosoma brucei equiperdum TaxID=630700 RepID=A0A3L6L9E7_9TRYP|nr:hypothetical protein DPX39_040032000 [Trypanosoma brucei equiperdum]